MFRTLILPSLDLRSLSKMKTLEERRKYDREWKRKWRSIPGNLEKAREIIRRSHNKHREKYKAAARAKWAADPIKGREKSRAFYARHKERIRQEYRENPQRSRDANARWAKRHPEKLAASRIKSKARVALWLKQHPEKAAEYQNKRRAKKRDTGSDSQDCTSKIQFLRLMPFCQYCFTLINGTPAADHVIPLNRGGNHIPSNLVASCKPCNSSKRDKLLTEWRGREMKEAA